MRFIWNTSHREFTVFDYYYFSELERFLKERGMLVENKVPLTEFSFKPGDVLVLNYPEIPFSEDEIKVVSDAVSQGIKLVVASYYQNEDDVSDICNELLSFSGISFNNDGVSTFEDGLLTTASVSEDFNKAPFKKVYFPCSCSLDLSGDAKPLLEVNGIPVAAYKKHGEGEIIALGTAVFWDNFSIGREDNLKFVEWLFS